MHNMQRGGNFDFWRSTSVSTINDYSTVQRNRLRLEFMHVSLHSGTLKLSMATTTHRASGLLVDARDKLLADKSFGPPSAAAVTARKTGECLHQWCALKFNVWIHHLGAVRLLLCNGTFSIPMLAVPLPLAPRQFPRTGAEQNELTTRNAWVFFRNSDMLGLSLVTPLCLCAPKYSRAGFGRFCCSKMLCSPL